MSTPERLGFESYFNSQGRFALQAKLLIYLTNNTNYSYEELVQGLESRSRSVVKYVNSENHSPGSNGARLPPAADYTTSALMKLDSTYRYESPVEYIMANDILFQDERFLKQGRPSNRTIYDGRKNPSHFIMFGFLGLSTGCEEYDELYQQMRPYTLRRQADSYYLGQPFM